MGNYLLLLLILWPLLGSLALLCPSVFSDDSGDDGTVLKRTQDRIALSTGLVEAVILILAIVFRFRMSGMETLSIPYIEGFGLNFRFDGFRIVYSGVTVLMWVCSLAVSGEYFHESASLRRYYIFCLWTFGATIGVFLSADFLTAFTFFEIMSLASYAFVAHTETKDSLRAAQTYLAVAVIGGLIMLMGILMLYNETGTLDFLELKDAVNAVRSGAEPSKKLYIAGYLILLGFGAKAGMFPLHIWLPKAHPVAPAPASALLSGVLTKGGIFGILILCLEIFEEDFRFGFTVIILGVITMLTGAVLAVFSVDLKRTLACSSVSQIGFILIGIGLVPLLKEECTLALSGALLYMVNHSMFKLTLFLCAAAIYMKCHMLNINDLKGYGRNMPVLKVLFLIGALGISGVPLLSGYVSKTLIHEGLVEYIAVSGSCHGIFKTIEILFLASGGMTFAYMMKIFHAIFTDRPEKDCKYAPEHDRTDRISVLSYVAISLPAAVIVFFGLFPKVFINGLAVLMGSFNTRYFDAEQLLHLENLHIFSFENLKGSLISLSLGAVFYVCIRLFTTEGERWKNPKYLDLWPKVLDLEELVYRPFLCRLCPFVFRTVGRFIATDLVKAIWKGIIWVGSILARLFSNVFDTIVELLKKSVFTDIRHREHKRLKSLSEHCRESEGYYKVISSGISFGLLLICFGLCITIFYVLLLLFA